MLSACSDSDPATEAPAAEPKFRADGSLDFMRADSTLLTRIFIEIAEDAESQATGMMYRKSMAERTGMLFVSEEPSMKSFWMRNTLLSLDVLFLDSEGGIINIVKRTAPLSEDRILSTAPAQYVLEVRAGFTDKYGIEPGQYITWERRSFDTES